MTCHDIPAAFHYILFIVCLVHLFLPHLVSVFSLLYISQMMKSSTTRQNSLTRMQAILYKLLNTNKLMYSAH